MDLIEVEKLIPEVISVEKETASRLQELGAFKSEELKKWCEKTRLKGGATNEKTKEVAQKRREKKA